jgi:hypothetical protein
MTDTQKYFANLEAEYERLWKEIDFLTLRRTQVKEKLDKKEEVLNAEKIEQEKLEAVEPEQPLEEPVEEQI